MTEPGPDVEGAKAYLESLTGQIKKLVEEGPEIAQRASQLQASATSPDGLVTATVDARGSLIELELDPRIYRRPNSVELGELIVETTRQAAATVTEQMLDEFEVLGDREQFEVMLGGDMNAVSDDIQARTQHWGR